MTKEQKIFCYECRKDVTYTITEEKMECRIKGEKYSFNGKVARCDECGAELYIGELNDINLKLLYDEYRKAHGLISLEDIRQIPGKYAIGKRPLSVLLGWGEQTFSRYYEGDIPSGQYSDVLRRIHDDPEYYLDLLERGRKNVSDVTYRKSREAATSCVSNVKPSSAMELAIGYILNTCEDITPLALQKALYYIQGFYHAFYDKFLFTEDCQAWIHGPVYRDVYFRYRNYQFDPIKAEEEFDDSVLTASEKVIFENVSRHLCCYSGRVLERFTHMEYPWLLARGNLSESDPSSEIITKESIASYFGDVKNKYQMVGPGDIKVYAENMFKQI